MAFSGFFKKINDSFQKLFSKPANFTHFALATITYAAPVAEGILAVTDPAAEVLVAPIITRIESGLAVAYSLSSEGAASSAPLSTTLADLQKDFSTVSQVAGIKDPATQAKITTIIGQIQSVLALIPNAPAAAAPAATPAAPPTP